MGELSRHSAGQTFTSAVSSSSSRVVSSCRTCFLQAEKGKKEGISMKTLYWKSHHHTIIISLTLHAPRRAVPRASRGCRRRSSSARPASWCSAQSDTDGCRSCAYKRREGKGNRKTKKVVITANEAEGREKRLAVMVGAKTHQRQRAREGEGEKQEKCKVKQKTTKHSNSFG